jgi:hypothetical protein
MAIWTLSVGLPVAASDPSAPLLLGRVTRSEVEAAMPDWPSEAMGIELDPEAVARLPQALEGAEVIIYLGTWCSDSRRELARLWLSLDAAGIDEPPQLSYVAVDSSKTEPADLVAGVDLIRVPTVIVRRGGVETGRIIEESPNGLEIDLLALLLGRTHGWIGAREERWMEEEVPEP